MARKRETKREPDQEVGAEASGVILESGNRDDIVPLNNSFHSKTSI
jgi:hypothetical protein